MDKAKKIGLIVGAVVIAILVLIGVMFFMRSSTQRSIKDIQRWVHRRIGQNRECILI